MMEKCAECLVASLYTSRGEGGGGGGPPLPVQAHLQRPLSWILASFCYVWPLHGFMTSG